jgi:hypothetical protein
MGPILPLHALVIHQAHVGLVHQSRCLQAVGGALASHVPLREAPEFVIHEGRQPVERRLISVAPGSEQPAHSFIIGLRLFVRRWLKVLHTYTPGSHILPGQSFKDKESCG